MVCYFVGGSQLAAVTYSTMGWAGVSVLGAAIGAISLLGALADWQAPGSRRDLVSLEHS